MKNRLILFLVAVLIAVAVSFGFKWFGGLRGEPVVFETVFQNWSSGHGERKQYVINAGENWNELWLEFTSNITPTPFFPPPDFDSYTVIAFFAGTKPTGGYEVEITEVLEASDKIYIKLTETSPGIECVVFEAITEPYHIIKIPKTDKEIEFILNEVVTRC